MKKKLSRSDARIEAVIAAQRSKTDDRMTTARR
jgi:hypothetical protein